jgi:hypothetical protein
MQVVPLTAAASLPALGLRQGDQVAVSVGLPEAAVRRKVFQEGAYPLLAFSYRMQAQ